MAGTDVLRQLHVLPGCDRSSKVDLFSHQVKVD